MKKKHLFFAATLAILAIASCKKNKEPEFQPFESPISVEFNVPTVPITNSEVSLSLNPLRYNVDSVIKAHTSNKFDSRNVGSIHMTNIEITLLDPDTKNNAANFEYAKIINVNGEAPVVVGSVNLPDTFATSAVLQTPNNVNLKPLINDNSIYFRMSGKARRETKRPIKARFNAVFKFEK